MSVVPGVAGTHQGDRAFSVFLVKRLVVERDDRLLVLLHLRRIGGVGGRQQQRKSKS